MNANRTPTVSDRHAVILPLAGLLQRMESTPRAGSPDPDQYRALVARLSDLLAQAPMNPLLDQILRTFPAAGELYENIHYAHAGLCRSPLEAAVEAETRTRRLIASA